MTFHKNENRAEKADSLPNEWTCGKNRPLFAKRLFSMALWGASRASTAFVGPWHRALPPWNSWACPGGVFWPPNFPHSVFDLLFWAAVIGVGLLVIRRLFLTKNRHDPLLCISSSIR